MTQLQNSNASTKLEQATIATERLSGFWEKIDASDPEIFLAGVTELLATYSRATIERAMSVTRGLPAKFTYWPKIAQIKETLDAWEDDERRHRNLLARHAPTDMLAIPGPPPVGIRERLCAHYGIRDFPAGWDAVDLIRASDRHGANLPAVVESMLATGARAGIGGPHDRVVEHVRQAMLERLARDPGDLTPTDAFLRAESERTGPGNPAREIEQAAE